MSDAQLGLGDCVEHLALMPDSCVDLVLTSPPYDNLRNYKGTLDCNFEKFIAVAEELKRILKVGGVIVWVIADQTKNGSETGSSFKQALHFMGLSLNLHDTMIFCKRNPVPLTHNRYEQQFEYMFVFSKGRPKTFNPLLDPCKPGMNNMTHRKDGEELVKSTGFGNPYKSHKIRYNIWHYSVGPRPGRDYRHPAVFPIELAIDHILSWTNPGDIVVDPFMGSGTTGLAALKNGRKFMGFEIVPEYFEIAEKKLIGPFL